MSKDNDGLFKVKANGREYDARTGMTDAVYAAKVEDARARGKILPDSKELAELTRDIWTWTMLTGEDLTADGDVQIRRVFDGGVGRALTVPDRGLRSLRVCPAVVIE